MSVMKKITALLLCILMMLLGTGCEEEEVTPENKFFTYHLSDEPDNLDPQSASGEDAWTVIQNLFEGLCRLDENGKAIPGAAERWEQNDDATVFTFYLRDELCWSNEEPLVAQDFAYALKRALDPKTRCPMVDELFCIRGAQAYYEGTGSWDAVGIRVESSKVLRFELTESFVDFPAETAKSAYMPCDEEFFLSTGGRYGKEDDMMLTNGPFRFRSYNGWMYEEYLRLVRSTHYHSELEAWPTGLMFNIGAAEDPIKELKEGTINAALLAPEQVETAKKEGMQVLSFADNTYGILFNCRDDYLKSTATRRALVSALSRENFTGGIPADGAPSSGIIPEAISVNGQNYRTWAGVCADADFAQTPAQLLAAGLHETGHRKLPANMTVLCVDTQENRLIVNQLLAAWRNELGYYFNIETVSSESMLQSRIQKGNYRIVITSVMPEENSVTSLTDQLCVMSGYTSSTYDTLVGKFRQQPLESAKALEQLMVNDGVFYPVYTTHTTYAMGKTVTGLIVRPFGGGLDFRRAGRT